MERRKLLLLLCFLWVLVAVGGGLWRLWALGALAAPAGPQALARDGQGGLYVALDRELLHLDAAGRLKNRRSAAGLGLSDITALASGEGGTLFLYDSGGRRVHRCATATWICAPFSPVALDLDRNVQMAWHFGPDRRLLLSDNTRHRLLALDVSGVRLPLPGARWDFPNQVSTEGGTALLAESDRHRIVEFDPIANRQTSIALSTRARPYRFVRRDQHWWVIEAGVTLQRANLRHYRDGQVTTVATGLRDATALVDTALNILVAGREDWRLIAIDPDTGSAHDFGSAALREEFRARRQAMVAAREERARLPLLMLMLVAPGLVAGLLLQRRIDRDSAADTKAGPPPPVTAVQPVAAALAPAVTPARKLARIDTDRAALTRARALQNTQLARLGLVLVPLLLSGSGLLLWLAPAAMRAPLLPLLGLFALLPPLIGLALLLGRRRQDRLYDQHLLCGPDKLVHVVAGKPVRAVPYEDVWLGEDSLVLSARRLPLYIGVGRQRSALWQLGDLHRELGPRIPHHQQLGEIALGRALIARGRTAGLSVLAGRFAVALAVLALVLAKLASMLPVNSLGKLLHFLN